MSGDRVQSYTVKVMFGIDRGLYSLFSSEYSVFTSARVLLLITVRNSSANVEIFHLDPVQDCARLGELCLEVVEELVPVVLLGEVDVCGSVSASVAVSSLLVAGVFFTSSLISGVLSPLFLPTFTLGC